MCERKRPRIGSPGGDSGRATATVPGARALGTSPRVSHSVPFPNTLYRGTPLEHHRARLFTTPFLIRCTRSSERRTQRCKAKHINCAGAAHACPPLRSQYAVLGAVDGARNGAKRTCHRSRLKSSVGRKPRSTCHWTVGRGYYRGRAMRIFGTSEALAGAILKFNAQSVCSPNGRNTNASQRPFKPSPPMRL